MTLEKKALVSIIVPIFNTELFIAETIESIRNQTLTDIEIILVNDGSTDNSGYICENYVEKDQRIKYIEQENQGVSVARNNGLLNANGDYIYFMDSDDTIDENFIKSSYEIAVEEKSDMVIIGVSYCNRLPNVMALPTCASMISHMFLKKHKDVRFPEAIQPCEDGLFTHRLLALTNKISSNPDGIYHYRKHENQNHVKINENSDRVLNQIPKWLEIIEEFYKSNNFFNSHALHLALFIEHEPFELRYLKMPLNNEQKQFLHSIIRHFMFENVLPYLKERKNLSRPFCMFLKYDNYEQFDTYYRRYKQRRKIKQKGLILLSKIIPNKRYRRNLRDIINEEFG